MQYVWGYDLQGVGWGKRFRQMVYPVRKDSIGRGSLKAGGCVPPAGIAFLDALAASAPLEERENTLPAAYPIPALSHKERKSGVRR